MKSKIDTPSLADMQQQHEQTMERANAAIDEAFAKMGRADKIVDAYTAAERQRVTRRGSTK